MILINIIILAQIIMVALFVLMLGSGLFLKLLLSFFGLIVITLGALYVVDHVRNKARGIK